MTYVIKIQKSQVGKAKSANLKLSFFFSGDICKIVTCQGFQHQAAWRPRAESIPWRERNWEREQEIEESNWDIQVGQMLRKLGVPFVVVLNFLFCIRV